MIPRSILIALLAAAVVARADADECTAPAGTVAARPGSGGPPTEVRTGVFLLDVIRVNDRDQSITLDFNLNLRWTDPRLARDAGAPEVCSVALDRIWNPQIRILNQRELKPQLAQRLRVDRGGSVSYDQRYFGEIRSLGNFADFPLDARELSIELVAVDQEHDEVSLVLNEQRTGMAPRVAVANWTVGPQSLVPRPFKGIPGRVFAGAAFVHPMQRQPGYFVWNTIVPLVMIVLMSWCVFWVNPAHLGPQLGLAATSMLSLIAFRFTLGGLLPPVSYFTRLDVFLNGASMLVFLALAEAVVSSTVADRGNKERANRIDAWSRVLFPLAFAVVVMAAFLV